MDKMKKLLAALLVLALLPGLAACGQKQENAPAAAQSAAPQEEVYSPAFATVREDGESILNALLFTEDGVYAHAYEKQAGDDQEENVDRLYFIGNDGTLKPLDSYSPPEPAEAPEGVRDFESSGSLCRLFWQEDGSLLALERLYTAWYEGPEELKRGEDGYWDHVTAGYSYFVSVLDPDGSRLRSAKVEGLDGLYLREDNAVLDEKGQIVVSYSSEDYGVLALTRDGDVAWQIKCGNYVDRVSSLRDGRTAVLAWSGGAGEELQVLDGETGQAEETYPVPNEVYQMLPGGGDYDFYYTAGIKLFGYSLERGEGSPVLDWIACDVDSGSLDGVDIAPDGTVRGLVNDWGQGGEEAKFKTELVTITKVPAADLPEKTHLTLATLYGTQDLKRAVIDFNRHSDRCRIDMLDYSEYNTEEDYSAGTTKLLTEIMAGNMPDLLQLESELPYNQLAAKGLLEDLYPWLDGDPELSREDFFENILHAMEEGGGLYQVCSNFSVVTAIGAKSVVGDRFGWTYEELYEALDSMPEGCDIFHRDVTKEDILLISLFMDLGNYVDWEKATCSFDSPEFIELLEFADHFALNASGSYDPETDSEYGRISRGEQMLYIASIYEFTDLQANEALFGGEGSVSYIGFPTAGGSCGSAIVLDSGLAMSSRCADKEAGWEFLRRFFTEDFQSGRGYGLPTNRQAFEKALKEAATPEYETDGEGNVLLDENGEPIERSRGGMASSDGLSVEFYALSQKQVETLRQLISQQAQSVQVNTNLLELIQQEVRAYFEGQKTAEETARLIQSKVSLYISEQS